MPLSALVTAGALVLANSPTASAADTAPTGGTSASDDTGQVAATATATDTESSRQSRVVTVTATDRLTSKIKASGRASSRSTKTAKATRTVKVTSYAATSDQAMADAKAAARAAAHNRAAAAAKAKAASEAVATATSVARKRARHRAELNAWSKFGVDVIRKARTEKGKPYRWGAAGPNAFDCSGFVRYVMKSVGVKNLPRTSQAMANKTHRISKSSRKPGDLIFFTSGSHVYHVAVYAGKGMIWHAPHSGETVQKIKIWTSHYRVGRVVV
jgi:cell wall-associated NlpC family hydrolase